MINVPEIVITKNLPKISLVDEGVKFYLLSDGHISEGDEASLSLKFLNVSINTYLHETFTLEWNGLSFTFQFEIDPDESGLQVRSHNLNDGETVFLNNLADDLNRHFELGRDFDIHGSMPSHNIFINARENGSDFDIRMTGSNVTDMAEDIVDAGTTPEMLSGYKIILQPKLFTDPERKAVPLGSDAMSPDPDGITKFDIAQYFATLLNTDFQFPYQTNMIYSHPDGCLKYFVNYVQLVEGKYQRIQSTYGNPAYIIGGGLSKMDRSFYNDENREFFLYGSNSMKFLSWCPTTKKTTKSTPERLYFLSQEHGYIELWITAKERSGDQYSIMLASYMPDPYSILEFVVDYIKLSIPSYKDVVSYELYLKDRTDIISERRNYIIDETPYENVRHFIFKNSFDVYESLLAPGDFSMSTKLKKSVADTVDLDEFTTHKSTKKHFGSTEIQQYKGNTGFVDKDHLDYLRDFMLSEEVFFIYGNVLVPVLITSTKATMFKDREHLYSLSFKYEFAYNDHRYSKEIVEKGFLYLMIEDDYIVFQNGSDRLRF